MREKHLFMPFPIQETFSPGLAHIFFKSLFIAEKSKYVFPLNYIVNVHVDF